MGSCIAYFAVDGIYQLFGRQFNMCDTVLYNTCLLNVNYMFQNFKIFGTYFSLCDSDMTYSFHFRKLFFCY